jgi:anti-sigma regulatory factor (Ser/Thr protein kinase)
MNVVTVSGTGGAEMELESDGSDYTNAILHGNKEITNKNVTVQAHIRLKEIVIDISDEGDGIQTLPTKKEATELNYLEEGGRGLKLAVLMSDDIELYQNKIRLIFNR